MRKNYTESENFDLNNILIYSMAQSYMANPASFLSVFDTHPFFIYLNDATTYNFLNFNSKVLDALSPVIDSDLKQNTILKIKSISNLQVFYHADRIKQPFYSDPDFSKVCNTYQFLNIYGQMQWIMTNKIFVGDNECLNMAFKIKDFGSIGHKICKILCPLVEDIDNWRRFQTLSKKEKEILKFIAEGHSNIKIGSIFGISEHTVRTHREQIRKKINAHNLNEIIKFYEAFELINAF